MSVQTKVLSFAFPYLIEFLLDTIMDIINKNSLVELREKLVEILFGFTGKTEIKIDDKIVKFLIQEAFTVEHFEKYGKEILKLVRKTIIATDTKWDDKCLPLVDYIESLFD